MGETARRRDGDDGPRVAALFDFDSTIVRGDSIIPFQKFLMRKGVPTFSHKLQIAGSVLLHHARISTNDDVKRVFARQFAGHKVGEIEALCREFCDTALKPLVYPQARERIERHRKQGHLVIIASASVTAYLQMFGKELGADIVVGTELEQRDGAYTGRLATPNCLKEEKINRLRALPCFREIHMPSSYAYSDHIYDLPMLAMVGHPVLINPEPRLRKVGEQRQWPVEMWALSRQG
jgi:HAD superfamily hydrolase (TIGR01490 family)